jgi:predicted metal-binding membrane protein
MAMAVSMTAMMVPTAAPFFFVYGRDSRRPAGVVLLVLVYVAVWAVIGVGVDRAMSQVMLPSSWLIAAVAIALAVSYTVTPWSRWARARCREMCSRGSRAGGLAQAVGEGLRYSAYCVVCTAGVMFAVIALGMSNLFIIVVAAALMLALKVTSWPARARRFN